MSSFGNQNPFSPSSRHTAVAWTAPRKTAALKGTTSAGLLWLVRPPVRQDRMLARQQLERA